jgi:hypothetical protein
MLVYQLGKGLKLSLRFPPVHIIHKTFTSNGVPTNPIRINHLYFRYFSTFRSVSQFFRFNKSVPPLGGEPLLVSQELYFHGSLVENFLCTCYATISPLNVQRALSLLKESARLLKMGFQFINCTLFSGSDIKKHTDNC